MMSVAKLSAGNGFEYYIRCTVSGDARDRGHAGLADYYSDRGEAPGRWIGSGLVAFDGLVGDAIRIGDTVTEEQMRNLFGEGVHPNAEQGYGQVYQRHRDNGRTHKQAAGHA